MIIQEVVGQRRGDRFYPDISGVARSYNFYAFEPARPEEGVVTLALGLGKTIVDGGIAWTFSPAYPKKPPPFDSVGELLNGTQTDFWAVNMGKTNAYNPISETEYMVHASLADAEADDALYLLASTYDPERDRVIPGIGSRGPRVLDFAPLLVQDQFPLSDLVKTLLGAAEKAVARKGRDRVCYHVTGSARGTASGTSGFPAGSLHGGIRSGGRCHGRGSLRSARSCCVGHGDGQRNGG